MKTHQIFLAILSGNHLLCVQYITKKVYSYLYFSRIFETYKAVGKSILRSLNIMRYLKRWSRGKRLNILLILNIESRNSFLIHRQYGWKHSIIQWYSDPMYNLQYLHCLSSCFIPIYLSYSMRSLWELSHNWVMHVLSWTSFT